MVVASEQDLYQTIVLPRKLATGSIHDYLFCYCLLVGILFEVLRIGLLPEDPKFFRQKKKTANGLWPGGNKTSVLLS